MSTKRRLNIKPTRKPVLKVWRSAIRDKKLVYLICTPKPVKYEHGRSRIIYIGKTKNGIWRIASSTADKSRKSLEEWGVRELSVHLVTCTSRQNVETWGKLESGLLLAFKDAYGEVPKHNKQGHGRHWRDEFKYFHPRRLLKVVQAFERAE